MMPVSRYCAGYARTVKTTCHLSVSDIVFGTAPCTGSLLREDAEIIPIERLGLFARVSVAQSFCEIDKKAKRTLRLSRISRPVQTILLSWLADEVPSTQARFLPNSGVDLTEAKFCETIREELDAGAA